MDQILHGSARTTQAARLWIQNSEEGASAPKLRLGTGRRTVRYWRGRDFIEDLPLGPISPCSMALLEAGKRRVSSIASHVFAAGRMPALASEPDSASIAVHTASLL